MTIKRSSPSCEVMPVPSFNVINGGSHAGNRLACQETVDDVDNDRFCWEPCCRSSWFCQWAPSPSKKRCALGARLAQFGPIRFVAVSHSLGSNSARFTIRWRAASRRSMDRPSGRRRLWYPRASSFLFGNQGRVQRRRWGSRSVTIWKLGAKWCPNPPKSVLWGQTMRSSRHCPCVICAISIGRADLHHLCKTTTRLWSTRWLQKMGDLPTIYPIDEHMGLQWLPVPKFQIHMEMIGPVSSIGCINRVHHVESNGFSTSMEQLRKDWGSSSWQPRWSWGGLRLLMFSWMPLRSRGTRTRCLHDRWSDVVDLFIPGFP